METAVAFIFVLLQVMPAETRNFSLSVTPDTAFHGTKLENNVWRIQIGKEDSRSNFGDVHIDQGRLIIKTEAGELPFEAADKLGVGKDTDWKTLKKFGREPVVYELRRARSKVEFFFKIQGADHPQSIVATFSP